MYCHCQHYKIHLSSFSLLNYFCFSIMYLFLVLDMKQARKEIRAKKILKRANNKNNSPFLFSLHAYFNIVFIKIGVIVTDRIFDEFVFLIIAPADTLKYTSIFVDR